MIKLIMAPLNVEFIIDSINNSISDEQMNHLANMGFVRDAVIKVVAHNDGNLIVSVKDSRVAIGSDIAKKIYVEERRNG